MTNCILIEECPCCDSKNTIKKGFRKTKNNGKLQRWLCKDCGISFSENYGAGMWLPKFNKAFWEIKYSLWYWDKEKLSSRKMSEELKEDGIIISHQGLINLRKKFKDYLQSFCKEVDADLIEEI